MRDIKDVKKTLFDFLELDKIKKVLIISDNDEDGLTSALNGKLFFEKKGISTKVFFYNHSDPKFDSINTIFNSFKPDKTLFFDLNENFVFDIMQNIGLALKDFVVIDHHLGNALVNITQNHLILKPGNFSKIDPSKYPVSKMVFDLFGGIDWIAGIGVIGDFSFEQWDLFIKKSCENISLKELFELAEICSCIVSMHEKKINDLFNFLFETQDPKALLNSSFSKLNGEFQNILLSELNRVKEDGLFFDELDLIFFKTKSKLPSKLSNLISVKFSKTVVVYSVEKIFVKCSFRRQDFRVNCNELAKFSINGFDNSSGGGHFPASAAKFPKEYLIEFKKNIITYLEKNYSKK